MSGDLTLDDLIAPIGAQGFLARYWQRRHLRTGPHRAAAMLITAVDVESLISSLSAPDSNWIKVTREGASLGGISVVNQQGHPALARIYDAYRAGYTIQLAKMHKRWTPIGRLCRNVEESLTRLGVPLARRVGAHLHFGPPRGASRGAHYHTHDNFIVQVAGSKRWRLHAPIESDPVEPLDGDLPRDRLPPLDEELRLGPGDALYVPRGVIHEAVAEATRSLHVTLDVTPWTWVDLLSRVVLAQPAFREALPVGSWIGDRPSALLRQGLRERCAHLGDAGNMEELASALSSANLADLDTLPHRGLDDLDRLAEVALDTLVQHRPGAFSRLRTDGDGYRLLIPGSAMRGPQALREMLAAVTKRPRFAPRDLPDTLDDDSKIEFVRDLIREGLLEMAGEVARPTPPAPRVLP